MGNNYNGNNNGNNNANNGGVDRVVDKMLTNTIRFKLEGITYKIKTRDLGEGLCNLIDNMGLHEIDHVSIFPIKDERGKIGDFGVDAVFNLDRKIPAQQRTITRFGNKNANTTDPVLRAFAAKTKTGGYNVTDLFKKVMGPIAITDENDNVRVLTDPFDKRLAMVECDIMAVLALALNIEDNDPIDFTVVECEALSNSDKNVDFTITVEKTVTANAFKKRRSSGINYEARDRARMNDRRNRR